MRSIYEVIRRPIRSEKSTQQIEKFGQYTFQVAKIANKYEIRKAVQQLFNVKVVDVRTMVVPGKVRRVGRFENKKSNWKKAIVTLAQGYKIDLFPVK